MALDLAPFGIRVTLVEPGFTRTDFLDGSSLRFGDIEIPDCAEARERQKAFFGSRNHAQPGDPAKVAALVLRLSEEETPPLRILAGSDALERMRERLRLLGEEVEARAALSASTDLQTCWGLERGDPIGLASGNRGGPLMKLLISPASPYVRKVRILIREAGREAEVEEQGVATTALATDPSIPGHNPLGRIPVLIRDDGQALIDSRVICRFLDAQWGTGLYPEARLWEVLTLEALAEGILDSALIMAYEVRLRPLDRQWPDWIEAQWAKVARALDAMERDWADRLSGPLDMGQVGLACALGYLDFRHDGRRWREGRPRLAAWEREVARRPSLLATRPA